MTNIVEEIIEISSDMLIPHLNDTDNENTALEIRTNNLDHFEEIAYENLKEEDVIITQENTTENEEIVGADSQINVQDTGELELGSNLMAVWLTDGSTAFIKNIPEDIEYISEDACLIETQDNLILKESLKIIENDEEPKINLIIKNDDESSENVLTDQSIEINNESISISQKDDEDHKKEPEEFYYPMLQLEDGSTAYISIPQDLLSTFGLTMEEKNNNNEECEEPKQIEVNVVQESIQEQNIIRQINNKLTDEITEKTIRPRQFPCQYENCGKFYTTMNHLKVHERTHTGAKPYRCPVANCEKAFATGYGRKAHIRTHTGEKPHECPMEACTKSFKTSGDLQKHVRTHTGERPFLCPIPGCGRRFTTSNIRKVHVRTHTGEKPYVCPEASCQRAFASATNYKNHIRIHTGEKPYVCQEKDCGKRFTEYSSLYKHALVHMHFRPYACNLCPRRYRQLSNLSMHKRTFHGIIEAEDGTQLVLSDAVVALSKNSKKIRGINCQNFLFNKENNTLIAIPSDNVSLQIEEQEDANLEGNEESIEEREESSPSYLLLPPDLIRLEYDFPGNTTIDSENSIIIDSQVMETE